MIFKRRMSKKYKETNLNLHKNLYLMLIDYQNILQF